ncbi:MazG-like family protein [Streptomyces atriruber]|uniref:MazG-like family protein n=1 Tax=Streptomyces atriruber TaxID=545121 RepID=UPI0006E2583D|nr:MazG-like family protein [Streptomyces atriruber]
MDDDRQDAPIDHDDAADAADPWDTVDRLYAWLDSHNRQPPREALLLRMLKLSEEVGEVAQAVIGATGQNPRKGTTHGWDDVRAELCDVVVTAMVALRTLTPDAAAVLAAHLRRVEARATAGGGSGTGDQIDVPPGPRQASVPVHDHRDH